MLDWEYDHNLVIEDTSCQTRSQRKQAVEGIDGRRTYEGRWMAIEMEVQGSKYFIEDG